MSCVHARVVRVDNAYHLALAIVGVMLLVLIIFAVLVAVQ